MKKVAKCIFENAGFEFQKWNSNKKELEDDVTGTEERSYGKQTLRLFFMLPMMLVVMECLQHFYLVVYQQSGVTQRSHMAANLLENAKFALKKFPIRECFG